MSRWRPTKGTIRPRPPSTRRSSTTPDPSPEPSKSSKSPRPTTRPRRTPPRASRKARPGGPGASRRGPRPAPDPTPAPPRTPHPPGVPSGREGRPGDRPTPAASRDGGPGGPAKSPGRSHPGRPHGAGRSPREGIVADVGHLVRCQIPKSARRNSGVARFSLSDHSHIAIDWCKSLLLTPRKIRSWFRSPVHLPSKRPSGVANPCLTVH